jgi:hypothetical protein
MYFFIDFLALLEELLPFFLSQNINQHEGTNAKKGKKIAKVLLTVPRLQYYDYSYNHIGEK